MTDAELSAIEQAAKAATPGPWNVNKEEYAVFINHKKGTIAEIVSYEDCFDAAYIAAANPAAVLELIAELRQARAERDWLINYIVEHGDFCPSKEVWDKCTADQDEKHLCNECWLQAAKEAVK